MKKTMTIDLFLSWVFIQALPIGPDGPLTAGPGNGWKAMNGFADLWTVIDLGDAPSFTWYETGPPPVDALTARDAVRGLAGRSIDIPEGWNPFPEWPDQHGLIAADVATARRRHAIRPERSRHGHVVQLVLSAAMLRRGPDWTSELPKTQMIMRAGKPAWFVTRQVRDRLGRMSEIETDGYNARTGRPRPGAYRKHKLARSLVGDALTRLDWQIWVDALAELTESLRGKLQNHEIDHANLAREPWKNGPVIPAQPVENIETATGRAVNRA